MKKIYFFLFFIPFIIYAQPKAGYYNTAVGKADAALKTQLYSIISAGYIPNNYDYLYTIYSTSDITSTGNVWDMYSTCTWTPGMKKCGNYSTVCDCYNREHSIPQSWFDEAKPMVCDAFHVYPTDGKVNGQRSNYPHGECASGTTLAGGRGKLGSSTYAGYSGTVFEPIDEYKGDFARTYFYFTTRYMDIPITTGPTVGAVFGNTFGDLKSWCVDLYLKWHRQDPVSEKETVRNNAVEVHQNNRNPFIDYPKLAEHIWGTQKGVPWSFTSGIDELKIECSVWPNPVQDVLNIKTDEQNYSCVILNINGQQLIKEQLSGNGSLNINNLDNGMYLIKVQAGSRTSVNKFIVNK